MQNLENLRTTYISNTKLPSCETVPKHNTYKFSRILGEPTTGLKTPGQFVCFVISVQFHSLEARGVNIFILCVFNTFVCVGEESTESWDPHAPEQSEQYWDSTAFWRS